MLFVARLFSWRICGLVEQHAHETLGLRAEDEAFAEHHTVGARWKEFSGGNDFEFLLAADPDADDDRNAEAELDVFFDDVPATDFHRDLLAEAVLFKNAVDHPPRAEVARRQDEWITADVLKGKFLLASER